MKKIISFILVVILVLFLAGCTGMNQKESGIQDRGNQENKQLQQNDHPDIESMPVEELSTDEIEALKLTLEDEYKAEAIYQKILDKFGDVKPFSNIINAEQKHSDALIVLFNKYDLEVPSNDWYDKVSEFDSVEEACIGGVDAEIANVALYDGLFSKVDNEDVITVFTSLRDASQEKHLPAFQRCTERGR